MPEVLNNTEVSQSAGNVTERVVMPADKANAEFSKQVQDGCKMLAPGFLTGRPKRGEPSRVRDQLIRTVLTALAKDTQANGISEDQWETADKNIYDQARLIINELTDPDSLAELIDELAADIKSHAAALRLCTTNRVQLKGGIPATQYGMIYIGFAPKRSDLAASMYRAGTGEATYV